MKKYDITVRGKSYTDRQTGKEKNSYRNVGTLTEGVSQKDGKPYKILELHMFPFTEFSIFEQKPREGTQSAVEPMGYAEVPEKRPYNKKEEGTIDYGDPINPDDIPF